MIILRSVLPVTNLPFFKKDSNVDHNRHFLFLYLQERAFGEADLGSRLENASVGPTVSRSLAPGWRSLRKYFRTNGRASSK